MKADLFLHDGLVVTEHATFPGSVAVTDGKISGVLSPGEGVKSRQVIDLQGRVLFPGVIDGHAHFSEIGRSFEGYVSGSKSAAAGGITTILDMPLNDLPPTVNREKLIHKRDIVKDKSVVDYAHWGGLVDNNLDALAELHAEGVIGYKAFYSTVADYPRVNDDLLYAGLLQMKKMGNVIGLHAENDFVVSHLTKKLQEEDARIGRRGVSRGRHARSSRQFNEQSIGPESQGEDCILFTYPSPMACALWQRQNLRGSMSPRKLAPTTCSLTAMTTLNLGSSPSARRLFARAPKWRPYGNVCFAACWTQSLRTTPRSPYPKKTMSG